MPIPIKEIADNLTEERCVLLLGPNTAVNTQGEPMQDALLAHLEAEGYPVGEDIDGLCRCDEATASGCTRRSRPTTGRTRLPAICTSSWRKSPRTSSSR